LESICFLIHVFFSVFPLLVVLIVSIFSSKFCILDLIANNKINSFKLTQKTIILKNFVMIKILRVTENCSFGFYVLRNPLFPQQFMFQNETKKSNFETHSRFENIFILSQGDKKSVLFYSKIIRKEKFVLLFSAFESPMSTKLHLRLIF